MQRRSSRSKHRCQYFAPFLKRLGSQVRAIVAEHIEKDDGCRGLLGKQLHSRGRWMKPKLQRVEIECAVSGDNDLAVQRAALRQLGAQRSDQIGEEAIQWLRIAALDHEFVMIAKDQRAKTIPFR